MENNVFSVRVDSVSRFGDEFHIRSNNKEYSFSRDTVEAAFLDNEIIRKAFDEIKLFLSNANTDCVLIALVHKSVISIDKHNEKLILLKLRTDYKNVLDHYINQAIELGVQIF